MIRDWWYIILCCVILVMSQTISFVFPTKVDEVTTQEVVDEIPTQQTENTTNVSVVEPTIIYENISVIPENIIISRKNNFIIDIYCTPTEPIVAYEFKLLFDSTKFNVISVSRGNIFNDFVTMFSPGIIDNENGTIINIYELLWPTSQGNVTDAGILVSILFNATALYDSLVLDLYDVGITNEREYINTTVSTGIMATFCAYAREE